MYESVSGFSIRTIVDLSILAPTSHCLPLPSLPNTFLPSFFRSVLAALCPWLCTESSIMKTKIIQFFFFSPPSSHCFLLGSLFILIYFITTCCLFNSYYFLLGSDLNYKRITVLYFLTKIFFLQNLIGWKRDQR